MRLLYIFILFFLSFSHAWSATTSPIPDGGITVATRPVSPSHSTPSFEGLVPEVQNQLREWTAKTSTPKDVLDLILTYGPEASDKTCWNAVFGPHATADSLISMIKAMPGLALHFALASAVNENSQKFFASWILQSFSPEDLGLLFPEYCQKWIEDSSIDATGRARLVTQMLKDVYGTNWSLDMDKSFAESLVRDVTVDASIRVELAAIVLYKRGYVEKSVIEGLLEYPAAATIRAQLRAHLAAITLRDTRMSVKKPVIEGLLEDPTVKDETKKLLAKYL